MSMQLNNVSLTVYWDIKKRCIFITYTKINILNLSFVSCVSKRVEYMPLAIFLGEYPYTQSAMFYKKWDFHFGIWNVWQILITEGGIPTLKKCLKIDWYSRVKTQKAYMTWDSSKYYMLTKHQKYTQHSLAFVYSFVEKMSAKSE